MSRSKILPKQFYRRDDVVSVSRELLGKVICTRIDGKTVTSGIITETEAYCGRNDKACHAYQKRTPRTEVMYRSGGIAYVYLCYGIHHLFNIVTNIEGQADAVLVRAIQPVDGTGLMLDRRGMDAVSPKLTAGPGRLSQALGITTDYNATDLAEKTLWIEDRGLDISEGEIEASTRIGVEYAGKDAKRPWRFYLKENAWVS